MSDYSNDYIRRVAEQFAIPTARHIQPFDARGNINLHTYLVIAGDEQYLLQKINTEVFSMPYRVMRAMKDWIACQEQAIADGVLSSDEMWSPITLIHTTGGLEYLDISDDLGWSVWRMMKFIPNTKSYKSLQQCGDRESQLELAREVGRGLAINADLTAKLDTSSLTPSLPGYRDTRSYVNQFESILSNCRTFHEAERYLPTDPELRNCLKSLYVVSPELSDREFESRKSDPELQPFIQLVQENKGYALTLQDAVRDGRIRMSAIHGDTKLENFLFCSNTSKVRSLVDLDTIMPFTWLADWGDMLRSLVNVAGEKAESLDDVRVDLEVYRAVAHGFLSTAKSVDPAEIELMADAVPIIALELGIRFLTDYLRGDTYFGLMPSDSIDLNKTRAMVQLSLFARLQEGLGETNSMLGKAILK